MNGVRSASIAVLLAACSPFGERAVMSVDEYAGYRNFRVAPSVEARLGASYEYLRRNPRGYYRDEVSSWFSHEGPTYVDRNWNRPSGLRAFLRSVPAGPEADRAAKRLTELEITLAHTGDDWRRFDKAVLQIEEKLHTADVGRRALVSDTVRWVRRIAGIRSWGGRTSELDHEFIYAYRLSAPYARCTENACNKLVTVAYAVPEGGAQSPREALYEVGLRLERGGVAAAWITGPELFTRLGEAVGVHAVESDFVGRAEAIGQATSLVALAVEPLMPSARCAAESVSPVVLRRVCDGVELRVIAATELGEEDRVIVEPIRRQGTP